MAMKKKFLGLAMAGAMVLSASSVYADTVTGNVNDTLRSEVTVTGTVTKNDGTAPAGKLVVELPTTMAFSVDEDGVFSAGNYEVSNKSAEAISVSVAEFRETITNGGIELQTHDQDMTSLSRDNVKLALVGDNDKYIDLADKTAVAAKKELLNVAANNTGTIQLLGDAGKDKTVGQNTVEANGASEDFTLVFEIKKA